MGDENEPGAPEPIEKPTPTAHGAGPPPQPGGWGWWRENGAAVLQLCAVIGIVCTVISLIVSYVWMGPLKSELTTQHKLLKKDVDLTNKQLERANLALDALTQEIPHLKARIRVLETRTKGDSMGQRRAKARVRMLRRARHDLTRGNLRDALDLFAHVCLGDHEGRACFEAGEILSKQKKTTEAISFFRRGCSLGNSLSCNNLGHIHFRAERTRKALDSWWKGTRLGNPAAAMMLAEKLDKLRRLPEAVRIRERFCLKNPDLACIDTQLCYRSIGLACRRLAGYPDLPAAKRQRFRNRACQFHRKMCTRHKNLKACAFVRSSCTTQ